MVINVVESGCGVRYRPRPRRRRLLRLIHLQKLWQTVWSCHEFKCFSAVDVHFLRIEQIRRPCWFIAGRPRTQPRSRSEKLRSLAWKNVIIQPPTSGLCVHRDQILMGDWGVKRGELVAGVISFYAISSWSFEKNSTWRTCAQSFHWKSNWFLLFIKYFQNTSYVLKQVRIAVWQA